MVTLEQVQQAREDYREVLKQRHSLKREQWHGEQYKQLTEQFYELYNKWHKLYNRREYEMRKARQLAKKASV
jgi:hypothetical protein